MKSPLYLTAALIMGLLWCASLFFDVFISCDRSNVSAKTVLIFGWAGYAISPATLGWFGNIFLLPCFVMSLFKHPPHPVAALLAITCALTSFRVTSVPEDEAGNVNHICGYGPGFWLWMASYGILFISMLHGLYTKRRIEKVAL
jgi:hypothetical protein